ncbi:metallophosphoesterase family protein [Longispora albida]|uniref:metallophosphoesterase family protein n=1 Tax=Longispora albida TaxID=203523 RepID=UPI000371E83B|nr:metallophosphoesterase [Longispora albida]
MRFRTTLRAFYQAVRVAVRHEASRAAARRTGRALGLLLVATVGVAAGLLLGGTVQGPLGPFQAEFSLTPGLHGGTQVVVPPLGSLTLDSHAGPERLTIRLDSLDQARTQRLVSDPDGLGKASESAFSDVQSGIVKVLLQSTGAALLGAMLLGALVYRSVRRTAAVALTALGLIAASLGTALVTFRSDAIDEPRYDGLLVNAPAVVGDARKIASRYEQYRGDLQRLVTNVGKLYTTVSTLPVYEPEPGVIRALHVSDMHLNPGAWDVVQTVVTQFSIDVVIDTGDLTDWGTGRESEAYARGISDLKVPYVFVRGNHDSAETVAQVARQPNAIVLDNRVQTVAGLRIGGIADPRFTPDKSTTSSGLLEERRLFETGTTLATTIGRVGGADIAAIHDPVAAGPLAGAVPLVLAGHKHKREVRQLDPKTLLMVEGSTGGAGLRGLELAEPTPLALSVLYFSSAGKLQAYDDISVGGTGRSEVTLQRRLIKETPPPIPTPTPAPTPS